MYTNISVWYLLTQYQPSFSYSSPGEKRMQKKTARIKKSCPCETEPVLVKEVSAWHLCLCIVRRGVFALSGLPADLEILLVPVQTLRTQLCFKCTWLGYRLVLLPPCFLSHRQLQGAGEREEKNSFSTMQLTKPKAEQRGRLR